MPNRVTKLNWFIINGCVSLPSPNVWLTLVRRAVATQLLTLQATLFGAGAARGDEEDHTAATYDGDEYTAASTKKKKRKKSLLESALDVSKPEPFEYELEMSEVLLMILLGFTYCIITPLIVPFASFYFFAVQVRVPATHSGTSKSKKCGQSDTGSACIFSRRTNQTRDVNTGGV